MQKPSTNRQWPAQLCYGTAALIIWFGWRISPEAYLTAEVGLGYLLGIVGASLMALLLLYPLRKNRVFPFRFGAIHHWFRIHMIFGVLGPIIILYHSNFQLGSVNSNIALFCMILVASSGLIGRYFYTRIHYGLYGAHATLEELQQNLANADHQIGEIFAALPEIAKQLRGWEQQMLQQSWGKCMQPLIAPWLSWRTRSRLNRLVLDELKRYGKEQQWDGQELRKRIDSSRKFTYNYVETVRKVAEISLYEKLFSCWHVLHMPLFIMMLITGVIHIFAVHMY